MIMALFWITIAIEYVYGSFLFYKAIKSDKKSDFIGYLAPSAILFALATAGLIWRLTTIGVIPQIFD